MKLTAGNVICGEVEKITHDTVVSEIELRLEGGTRLVALIERQSMVDLGLEIGSRAYAVIRAEEVSVEIETRSEP